MKGSTAEEVDGRTQQAGPSPHQCSLYWVLYLCALCSVYCSQVYCVLCTMPNVLSGHRSVFVCCAVLRYAVLRCAPLRCAMLLANLPNPMLRAKATATLRYLLVNERLNGTQDLQRGALRAVCCVSQCLCVCVHGVCCLWCTVCGMCCVRRVPVCS
jgi:hypothetical protein